MNSMSMLALLRSVFHLEDEATFPPFMVIYNSSSDKNNHKNDTMFNSTMMTMYQFCLPI